MNSMINKNITKEERKKKFNKENPKFKNRKDIRIDIKITKKILDTIEKMYPNHFNTEIAEKIGLTETQTNYVAQIMRRSGIKLIKNTRNSVKLKIERLLKTKTKTKK